MIAFTRRKSIRIWLIVLTLAFSVVVAAFVMTDRRPYQSGAMSGGSAETIVEKRATVTAGAGEGERLTPRDHEALLLELEVVDAVTEEAIATYQVRSALSLAPFSPEELLRLPDIAFEGGGSGGVWIDAPGYCSKLVTLARVAGSKTVKLEPGIPVHLGVRPLAARIATLEFRKSGQAKPSHLRHLLNPGQEAALVHLAEGSHEVAVHAPGYETLVSRIDIVPGGRIDIILDLVRGVRVDGDLHWAIGGLPVKSGVVRFVASDDAGTTKEPVVADIMQGRFIAHGVDRNARLLEIHIPGWSPLLMAMGLEGEGAFRRLDISLPGPVSIKGMVQDGLGQPVSGHTVQINSRPYTETEMILDLAAREHIVIASYFLTGPDGSFSVDAIGNNSREAVIAVYASGAESYPVYVGMPWIDKSEWRSGNVTLKEPIILDGSGNGTKYRIARLVDGEGAGIPSVAVHIRNDYMKAHVISDAEGWVEMGYMPKNTLWVNVLDGNYWGATSPFKPSRGPRDIVLLPLLPRNGRVVNEAGLGCGNCVVSAEISKYAWRSSITADADGIWALNIPEGDVVFSNEQGVCTSAGTDSERDWVIRCSHPLDGKQINETAFMLDWLPPRLAGEVVEIRPAGDTRSIRDRGPLAKFSYQEQGNRITLRGFPESAMFLILSAEGRQAVAIPQEDLSDAGTQSYTLRGLTDLQVELQGEPDGTSCNISLHGPLDSNEPSDKNANMDGSLYVWKDVPVGRYRLELSTGQGVLLQQEIEVQQDVPGAIKLIVPD